MDYPSKSNIKKAYISSLTIWFVMVLFFMGITLLGYKFSVLYEDTLHSFQKDIGQKLFAESIILAYSAVLVLLGLSYMIYKRRLRPQEVVLPLMRHIGKWPRYSQLPSTIQFKKSQSTPRILLSLIILIGLFLYLCSGDTEIIATFFIIYSGAMIAIFPKMKNLRLLAQKMASVDAFHFENRAIIKKAQEGFEKDIAEALPVLMMTIVILPLCFSCLFSGNFTGILFCVACLIVIWLMILFSNFCEKKDGKSGSDNILLKFKRTVIPAVQAFMRVIISLKARHFSSGDDPISVYYEKKWHQADKEIIELSESQNQSVPKDNHRVTSPDDSDVDGRYFDLNKLKGLLIFVAVWAFLIFPEVTEAIVGKEIFESIKSGIQLFLDFITDTLKISHIPAFDESSRIRFNALFFILVVVGFASELVQMIWIIGKIIYDKNIKIHQKELGGALFGLLLCWFFGYLAVNGFI